VTGAGAPPAGEGFALVAGLSAADVETGSLAQAKHPNGTALCVGRHENTLFVVKDSCPHAEFPLSEGTLYPDGELECCWHGARFDCRSGAVLAGPAEDPLVRYEVEERDGGIWVRRAR
jgi:3-phenylpropionate/trans-cinnamate dioxygenase ferredoxin subunit